MKINTTKKRPFVPILAFMLIALLAGWLMYVYSTHQWPFTGTPASTTSSQHNNTSASDNQTLRQKKDIPASPQSPNVDTTKTTADIPVANNLSVAIDTVKADNNEVSYTATAKGTMTGTCSAVFTSKLGKPVTITSDTTTGKCQGSVSAMEFDALGTWTLTLRYYANNTQAVATSTVEVR